jgi:hypothetical protein
MTDAEPPVAAGDGEHAVPLVFISHDTRDAPIAEAFSKLLSSVTAGMLKTFRSSDNKGTQGFEYGVEWFPELMKKLASASDMVCLLTNHSLARPWILFEAGVAKGKFEIPVHGLALGIPLPTASATGPFQQLHNCDDDVESITKLTMQLINRLPGAEPDRETIRSHVEVFVHTVNRIAEAAGEAGAGDDNQGEALPVKLFEEIKVMFAALPSRLEAQVVPAFYNALTEVFETIDELTGASRLDISLVPNEESKRPGPRRGRATTRRP